MVVEKYGGITSLKKYTFEDRNPIEKSPPVGRMYFMLSALLMLLLITFLFAGFVLPKPFFLSRSGGPHIIASHTKEKLLSSPFNRYRIVCYYVIPNNQTHSRQLPPSYVDPYLCTHIIIGFAAVYNGTLAPVPSSITEVYKTIINFKEMNPSMKILLSIEDLSSNGQFGNMVADENLRLKFSSHIIKYLESMKFDGVDLDWEFPAWPEPDEGQRKNFSLLLQNIRKEIARHNNQSYILSVAVGAPEAIIEQSYHIQDIAQYVDFINLMSYDYHMYTKYLPLTGPNSPLFPHRTDEGFMQTMNINWSATTWYKRGMPLEKINVGIPTYGHSFRLVNEDNNGWNAPANGFGNIGSMGFTTYPDACYFLSDDDTNQIFDETYLVPYAYNGKDWISYENKKSVENKANYIRENKFGGAMIFSLNSDDFYGECDTIKFPLLRQVVNILS